MGPRAAGVGPRLQSRQKMLLLRSMSCQIRECHCVGFRGSVQACDMTTDTGRLNSLRKDPIRPDTPEQECPLVSPHAPPFLLCLPWGGTRGRGLLSSEVLPWNPTPGTNHTPWGPAPASASPRCFL